MVGLKLWAPELRASNGGPHCIMVLEALFLVFSRIAEACLVGEDGPVSGEDSSSIERVRKGKGEILCGRVFESECCRRGHLVRGWLCGLWARPAMSRKASLSSDVWASPHLSPQDGDWECAQIGFPFPFGQEDSLLPRSMTSRQRGQYSDCLVPIEENTLNPQHLLAPPESGSLDLEDFENYSVTGVPVPFSGGVQGYSYQEVPATPMSRIEAQGDVGNPDAEIDAWLLTEPPAIFDASMPSVTFQTVSHAKDS
ncbi:hypothetical protein VTH06DRAFT_269 [Thermothelomyces fergusii]